MTSTTTTPAAAPTASAHRHLPANGRRTPVSTYRLQLGAAGASSAIDIARRMGLPETICVRATSLAQNAGVTLHVTNHYGANSHHIAGDLRTTTRSVSPSWSKSAHA